MFWLHAAWDFLFGWAGLAVAIAIAATAVAILEPKQLDAITDLRKWAIVVAAVAFSFTAIAGKYFDDGIAFTKGEWEASLAREAVAGEAARNEAVATVGAVSSDRSMFRGDPRNRDRGKQPIEHKSPVRWLEGHHLFGR